MMIRTHQILLFLSIICCGPCLLMAQSLTDVGTCAKVGDGLTPACTSKLPPIILVPGFLGNKMYLKGLMSTFPTSPPSCAVVKTILQSSGLFPTTWKLKGWINALLGIGTSLLDLLSIQKCLFHLISLKYNAVTKTYTNQTGVAATFLAWKNFGLNCPSTCLLSDSLPLGCAASILAQQDEANFAPLINYLTAMGYQKGCNLFEASYDWRLTPDLTQMNAFYINFTNLIQTAYTKTGKRVFLLAHSMGNLVVNRFLNKRMGKIWQQKYVNATINVNAPWGGATFIIEQILSGNVDRLFPGLSLLVADPLVRDFIRSLAADAILLPHTLAFPSTQKLATISGTDYTVADMDNLLSVATIPYMATPYHTLTPAIDAQNYTKMFCVSSYSVASTPSYFNYSTGINVRPEVTFDDGDGEVNKKSAGVCQTWLDQGKLVKDVTVFGPSGPTHTGILRYTPFHDYVKSIVHL